MGSGENETQERAQILAMAEAARFAMDPRNDPLSMDGIAESLAEEAISQLFYDLALVDSASCEAVRRCVPRIKDSADDSGRGGPVASLAEAADGVSVFVRRGVMELSGRASYRSGPSVRPVPSPVSPPTTPGAGSGSGSGSGPGSGSSAGAGGDGNVDAVATGAPGGRFVLESALVDIMLMCAANAACAAGGTGSAEGSERRVAKLMRLYNHAAGPLSESLERPDDDARASDALEIAAGAAPTPEPAGSENCRGRGDGAGVDGADANGDVDYYGDEDDDSIDLDTPLHPGPSPIEERADAISDAPPSDPWRDAAHFVSSFAHSPEVLENPDLWHAGATGLATLLPAVVALGARGEDVDGPAAVLSAARDVALAALAGRAALGEKDCKQCFAGITAIARSVGGGGGGGNGGAEAAEEAAEAAEDAAAAHAARAILAALPSAGAGGTAAASERRRRERLRRRGLGSGRAPHGAVVAAVLHPEADTVGLVCASLSRAIDAGRAAADIAGLAECLTTVMRRSAGGNGAHVAVARAMLDHGVVRAIAAALANRASRGAERGRDPEEATPLAALAVDAAFASGPVRDYLSAVPRWGPDTVGVGGGARVLSALWRIATTWSPAGDSGAAAGSVTPPTDTARDAAIAAWESIADDPDETRVLRDLYRCVSSLSLAPRGSGGAVEDAVHATLRAKLSALSSTSSTSTCSSPGAAAQDQNGGDTGGDNDDDNDADNDTTQDRRSALRHAIKGLLFGGKAVD